MIAFFVRRLFQSVFVMLTVALIAFSLFNYVGDPVHGMVGEDTATEAPTGANLDGGLDFDLDDLGAEKSSGDAGDALGFDLIEQTAERLRTWLTERLPT